MRADIPSRSCIFNFDGMRRFLLKTMLAVIFSVALVFGVGWLLHERSKNNEVYDADGVFVLGDSQMRFGIDKTLLSNLLGVRVLNSSEAGKGVYDFLVSEKRIPEHAVCLLSFPESAFCRNPLSDDNRTGLDIQSLFEIYQSGCPLKECVDIFNLNKKSFRYQAFSKSFSELLVYADSLEYYEPLSLWHSLLEEPKDWFSWKAKAYSIGIQHVFEKHSRVILVQFPYDKQVELFAKTSCNRHLSDSLKFALVDRYALNYDTIVLHSDSLLMHDLSHMNEVGARLLTLEMAKTLQKEAGGNCFFTVVIN